MDDAQHEAIARVVHELKGMFIVSGYKMPLYEELFAVWRCVTTQAYADGGLSKQECLWLSPYIAHQGLFDASFS